MTVSQVTSTGITNKSYDIPTSSYTSLIDDILASVVRNETSSFNKIKNDIKELIRNEVDFDELQKQGVYSDFIRDTYLKVEQIVDKVALQIVTFNKELEMTTTRVEKEVNLGNLKVAGLEKDKDKVEQTKALMDVKKEALEVAIIQKKYEILMFRAMLEKKLGIQAYLPENDTDALKQSMNGEGVIDKQIAGFDKVHYKALIKMLSEFAAMFTNAQETPPAKTLTLISELIYKVESKLPPSDLK